jgi:hypothetical protein
MYLYQYLNQYYTFQNTISIIHRINILWERYHLLLWSEPLKKGKKTIKILLNKKKQIEMSLQL